MKRKYLLLTILLLLFCLSYQLQAAPDTTTKKTLAHSKPTEPLSHSDFIKYVIIPLIAISIQFGIFIFQTALKRRDDKLTLQLNRIDKQISDLYGPLYALYHIGDKHFLSFKRQNHRFEFIYPGYKIWLQEVFMKTNIGLEAIIAGNADLFVGGIPKDCIEFCQHVAALKTCLADINNPNIRLEELDHRMNYHPHPLFRMQSYVIAAYVVLKKEQSRLLSSPLKFPRFFMRSSLKNPRKLVDEGELCTNINLERSFVYKILSESNDEEREDNLYIYLIQQGVNTDHQL